MPDQDTPKCVTHAGGFKEALELHAWPTTRETSGKAKPYNRINQACITASGRDKRQNFQPHQASAPSDSFAPLAQQIWSSARGVRQSMLASPKEPFAAILWWHVQCQPDNTISTLSWRVTPPPPEECDVQSQLVTLDRALAGSVLRLQTLPCHTRTR